MKSKKLMRTIVFAAFFITSTVASAADTLVPGTSLQAGQHITSNSGKYRLILQNDGNLVYYRNTDGSVRWNTGTNSGTSAPMQADGNFVLYNQGGNPIWNSATSGYPGASISTQDDGNLVIYQNGRALWSTGADPENADPTRAGDVVLRDLDVQWVPFLGAAFGHIALYDGANIIEVLNEPGPSKVFYNTLANFKSRTPYKGRASPNIPDFNLYGCWDAQYCGPSSYAVIGSRVAIVRRALQIYGIGSDYTLTAQYTIASPKSYGGPNFPNIQAVRGLYRCDTFVLDVIQGQGIGAAYRGPNGEQAAPPVGSATEKWFFFVVGGLRSLILPTAIFAKLRDYI